MGTFLFTGIITTGSTLAEYYYYVSAYRILYSSDAQKWTVYREPGVERDKVMLLCIVLAKLSWNFKIDEETVVCLFNIMFLGLDSKINGDSTQINKKDTLCYVGS